MRLRAIFSPSPWNLEARELGLTLMNVVPHSVATAFASIVLPVPGGPNMSTPFQGRRMPCGQRGKLRHSEALVAVLPPELWVQCVVLA